MGWGAPQGPASSFATPLRLFQSVAGEVTEVPVVANAPLKTGDLLFKIDPAPYEAQVEGDRGAAQIVATCVSPR